MADSKLSALASLTTPAAEDLMYIVDDPSGTPVSKKVTVANARKLLTYADATARDAALPSPSDGMVAGQNDIRTIAAYLQSYWRGMMPCVMPSGDTSGETDRKVIQDFLTNTGHVVFLPGHYYFDQGISSDGQDVALRGDGVTLDFSPASTTFTNDSCISLDAGEVDSLPAQTGNETAGNKVWDFDSAPNTAFAVGDVIEVEDTSDYSYSAYRTYYHKKERFVVREVNSTTQIETTTGAIFDWATADATWTRLPGYTATIHGSIDVIGPSDDSDAQNVIKIENMAYPRVYGIRARGGYSRSLSVTGCYGAAINSVNVNKEADDVTGTSYGIMVADCQNVTISDSMCHANRHGIVVGGTGLNVDIHVSHCAISSIAAASADFHGNTIRSSYTSCEVYRGMNVAGNYITVADCRIYREDKTYSVQLTEPKGFSFTFRNCYFGGIDSGKYAIYGSGIDSEVTEDGMMVLENLIFETPSAAASGTMLYLTDSGTGPSGTLSIEASGLRPTNDAIDTTSSFNIDFDDNTLPGSIRISNSSFPGRVNIVNANEVEISDCKVLDSAAEGILVDQFQTSCDVRDILVKECSANHYAVHVRSDDATYARVSGVTVLSACDRGVNISDIATAKTDLCVFENFVFAVEPTTRIINVNECTKAYVRGVDLTDTSKLQLSADTLYLEAQGAGTPEGNVTADIGSTFRRTDGGADTTLYVKESGTGNTGWEAVQTTGA